MGQFFSELEKITKASKNEPMKNHTTFKIGGPAKYFASPGSKDELKAILKLAKEYGIKTFVFGKGSNLLVSDSGIDGLAVHLGERFSKVEVCGEEIRALSGASLAQIAKIALSEGLSGFAFAAGIPGSLGGAVYMNAGAYGGEMKDVVKESYYLDENLNEYKVTEHFFGKRRSIYSDTEYIITEAVIKLRPGSREEIKKEMADYAARRREKQPLNMPSAGSVFKRPEGHFAGALIEGANLKGVSVGGAKVSEKHAGFIVNTGNAKASDVSELIRIIKDKVYEKYKVELETEIKFI